MTKSVEMSEHNIKKENDKCQPDKAKVADFMLFHDKREIDVTSAKV